MIGKLVMRRHSVLLVRNASDLFSEGSFGWTSRGYCGSKGLRCF
jgi:hypothetical protein